MAQFNDASEYLTRQQAGVSVATGHGRLRASLRAVLTYAILTLFLLIAVAPLLIIGLSAFKSAEEIAQNVFGLPQTWTLANFANAWSQARFDAYFRSSAIVAVPVVIVSCFLSILTGYAFGQLRFLGSAVLFGLFLIGIMVPGEAVIIPIYYNLREMGLIDTYWAMILPDIAFSVSFGTLWMRGFFSSVPRELIDAATVDGSNSWQTLWRILVPNAVPAILTMGILFFIWTWNDFLLPLVVVSRDDLRTLPLGLTFFQGRYSSDLPLLAAGATMVALPTIVVYVLMQRHFIRGLTSGAVK
ncbi:MAG TPA: carbohydrate ABC transporter permease [Thermomicrobiales bacterium]|nr:carbohydrate ABC transporter permease [Thermomicrobiales bacterium]